jgi:hypothetical protein
LAHDEDVALKTRGDLMDLGRFSDFVSEHDVNARIGFGVRFDVWEKQPERIQPVGKLPPGAVDLIFGSDEGNVPTLERFRVLDVLLRPMLTRNRLSNGRYSLLGPTASAARPLAGKGRVDRAARSAIRNGNPTNFLFTERALMLAALAAQRNEEPDSEFELSETVGMYMSIVNYSAMRLVGLLDGTTYLGPLREKPRRVYPLSSEPPVDSGPSGEHTAEVILNSPPELREMVVSELKRFGYHADLDVRQYRDDAFSLLLKSQRGGPELNYTDAGFGLSQLLPLLLAGLRLGEEDWLIAEQPEIHLNPRLQAELGEFFAERAIEGRTIIVETHSEHLLLRVRRLVAEKRLPASSVAIYYVERDPFGRSTLTFVPLRSNGHIDVDEWPRGFFSDGTREALAIATAQMQSELRSSERTQHAG